MSDSLSPSVTSFVITLIGASIALAACGVLVGTLTHRYRNQAIELARRYLGARGEHRAAVGQLERTLGQINVKQREVHLASAHAQSTAQLNARLQDQVLGAERKAHDFEDEAGDLRSKLVRAETNTIELETLAKQQQRMLAQAADESERARHAHAQAHALAADRHTVIGQFEQRVKDLVAQLANATRVAHDLHAHNQSMSRQLGDAEKRTADREREMLTTELQLASNTDKVAIAARVVETHAQHVARIAELGGHLEQAHNRLAELEKLHGEKTGTASDLRERVMLAEAALNEMIAESRERLAIITRLTDDLNRTRLSLGNAHLLVNQHEAINKEQWLKLQDSHTELASFKGSGQAAAMTAPAPQPIIVHVQGAGAGTRSDHIANLSPEQQDVVDRAHATPGLQSVLAKMANELLKTQRKLDGTQNKLDELLGARHGHDTHDLADVIKTNETEIASLKQDLLEARKRFDDATHRNADQAARISDLSRQVRDLDKRHDAARELADELREKLAEVDQHRQDLETELDQRRRFPGMSDDGMGFSHASTADGVPDFRSNAVEPPRFVQHHDRIVIEPPLDAIGGMTTKDISALRHAAVMTPGDLASLSPEQLQTIVKPTIWRRPDYDAWIRQARQMQVNLATPVPTPEVQPELVADDILPAPVAPAPVAPAPVAPAPVAPAPVASEAAEQAPA